MFSRLEPVNRIILSPGHGGLQGENFDPGATYEANTENGEAKQIINKLVPKLTNRGLVVVVIPDYGLSKTVAYINAQYESFTDWAFEIHKDSVAAFDDRRMRRRAGIYYHPLSSESKEIAEQMVGVYKRRGAHKTSWSRPDTDSRHKRLGWIRQTKMLSHLIECGFMQDDLGDASDEFYASIIAEGILSCLDKNISNL